LTTQRKIKESITKEIEKKEKLSEEQERKLRKSKEPQDLLLHYIHTFMVVTRALAEAADAGVPVVGASS